MTTRLSNMSELQTAPSDVAFDSVDSEAEDEEAALSTYEIVTYPADYTLSVLVDKWRRGQVKIPRFQRGFVWKQPQASRLIESFLIGLPVPAIFLYTDRSDLNNQLVVDGQQRLRTISYFFEGFFGEPSTGGKRQVFRLSGLHEKSPYLNKTYADLEREDTSAWNRLNDAVLRAFVIQQLDPADDTSIYHIFERLNTGGTQLHPQEIRNAVNHGAFNDILHTMNDWPAWRNMYGTNSPDKRQRDVELILRVIALSENLEGYSKPMKDFLNRFMAKYRNADPSVLDVFTERFRRAVGVADGLGARPFRRGAGLNAAVFDAVMTALMRSDIADIGPGALKARYENLMRDSEFELNVTRSTTDDEVVPTRIAIAKRYLEI